MSSNAWNVCFVILLQSQLIILPVITLFHVKFTTTTGWSPPIIKVVLWSKSHLTSSSFVSKLCHKYTRCQFKPSLWREVRLLELWVLDTIARHYSIQKWPSSEDRVCRRRMWRHPNMISKQTRLLQYAEENCEVHFLSCVFVYACLLEKIMPSRRCVALIRWRLKKIDATNNSGPTIWRSE